MSRSLLCSESAHTDGRALALPCTQTETISSLEKAIADAKKQCDEATAGDCAAAWDTVEELSAAIAHKKAAVRRSGSRRRSACVAWPPLEAFAMQRACGAAHHVRSPRSGKPLEVPSACFGTAPVTRLALKSLVLLL